MKDPNYFDDLHHHLIKISEKFIFIFFVILMFDELLDMFLSLCGHFFEFIEYSLDVLVEQMLATTDSQAEMISFYLISGIILVFLYFFIRAIPKLVLHFEHYLQTAWKGYRHRSSLYWHHLTIVEKIELAMTYFIESSFILFWLTM